MVRAVRKMHDLLRSNVRSLLASLIFVVLVGTPMVKAQQPPTRNKSASRIPALTTSNTSHDAEKEDLERAKLKLELEKLHLDNQNNERNLFSWRGWLNLLYGNVSVLVTVILAFVAAIRYIRERREELIKREDERFENVVKGLGDEQYQQRVSSAVLLPTFLRRGYERFYQQVFNLAAGNLRSRASVIMASAVGGGGQTQRRATDTTELPTTPLGRALTSVLRDSYPRARDVLVSNIKTERDVFISQHLNSAGLQLEQAFLSSADFREAWLRETSFREADLTGADLTGAVLEKSDFTEAKISLANLKSANVQSCKFVSAILNGVDLSAARADYADFKKACLRQIVMRGGTIGGADFCDADLSEAKFSKVDFVSAEGKKANPDDAKDLTGAEFTAVRGLAPDQIEKCKKKGALFTPSRSSAP